MGTQNAAWKERHLDDHTFQTLDICESSLVRLLIQAIYTPAPLRARTVLQMSAPNGLSKAIQVAVYSGALSAPAGRDTALCDRCASLAAFRA